MQKRVKIESLRENLEPNVLALVRKLEEKGFIDGNAIVYNDDEESAIAALFEKYYVPIF